MRRCKSTIEALETRRTITPNGCWEWTGPTNKDDYGTIWIHATNQRAGHQGSTHRASYEHFIGPIPNGLVIDHLCNNRVCHNPDHLEAVTQRTNLARSEHTIFSRHAGVSRCDDPTCAWCAHKYGEAA